jgi:hypothetical protein
MSSLLIAFIVFICVFSGSMFGQWLSPRLPEHHRSSESHDAVKLATGLISVLAALVLGLLIAGIKNSFDTTDSQIRRFASTLILLNETLRDYGPEAAATRELLRRHTARALEDNWPQEGSAPSRSRISSRVDCLTACASRFWTCQEGGPGATRCVPMPHRWSQPHSRRAGC